MGRHDESVSGLSSDIEKTAARNHMEVESIDSGSTPNMLTTTRSSTTVVEGSSRLYVEGVRQYVPMPTASPKDPLNLPTWRKAVIISSVCLFGAMAIAPEAILAALLPVFVFEYNGISPHVLDGLVSGLPQAKGGGVTPSSAGLLGSFSAVPYWKISLISTLPVLVIGISNYFLVPLSIAIGRRPVIIVCGLIAWIGAIWAGKSTSLESHLAARSLQAIGAGTVESLIPLIVQDLVFIHWRNRCFSAVWASQGIIIVTLGICSPIIIAATSWRTLYFITASLAAVTWLVVIFALPETRFIRSTAELRGEPAEPLPAGFSKPALNPTRYGHRTWTDELGFFTMGFEWQRAWDAIVSSFKSLFFPNIFFVILLNSLFSAVSLAAGQTGAMVLLTQPNSWHFRLIGLAVLPIVIASFFVAIFAGYGADKISNHITKKYRNGHREPEVHLINLAIPLLFAIAGCVMFGAGGSFIGKISWGVFVVGIGFLSFGLLSANVIFSTYVVESYPEWAGPVLVNVASLRNIIGFGFSFRVTDWIGELGFIRMFGVYAGVIAILSLGLIPMYIWGKQIRKYCGKYVWEQEQRAGLARREKEERVFETQVPEVPGIRTYRSKSYSDKIAAPTPVAVIAPKRDSTVRRSVPQSTTTSERRAAPAQASPEIRENEPKTTEKKKGINWKEVREYLNMKENWRDPAMH